MMLISFAILDHRSYLPSDLPPAHCHPLYLPRITGHLTFSDFRCSIYIYGSPSLLLGTGFTAIGTPSPTVLSYLYSVYPRYWG